jgi:hypothetical protein
MNPEKITLEQLALQAGLKVSWVGMPNAPTIFYLWDLNGNLLLNGECRHRSEMKKLLKDRIAKNNE